MLCDAYVIMCICVLAYMNPHVCTPSPISFFAPATFRNSDNVRVTDRKSVV